MSSKRLDKISDYARHGYAITVQCRSCGHSAKLDARAISDQAIRRNLSREIGKRPDSGHRCYRSFAPYTRSFTLAIATAKTPLFDEERVSRIRHRCMAPAH